MYICFCTGKRNNFQLAYTWDQAEMLIEWPVVYCCNGLFNVNSFSMWSWLLLWTAWTLYILIELYELFICNWISCFKNKINFTNWSLYVQFFQWYRADNIEMCLLLSNIFIYKHVSPFWTECRNRNYQVSLDFHCRKITRAWSIFICIWSAVYSF